MLQYRINAGRLPDGSWVTDPEEGGGRIISETCHFVDLAAFLLGTAPVSVFAQRAGGTDDDVVTILTFANGSVATIGYFAGGDRAYSKERVEVFGGGRVAVIDDFRGGWLVQEGRRQRLGSLWSRRQKGHLEEIEAFLRAVRHGGPSPVPFNEAVAATRATLAIHESLSRGAPVRL